MNAVDQELDLIRDLLTLDTEARKRVLTYVDSRAPVNGEPLFLGLRDEPNEAPPEANTKLFTLVEAAKAYGVHKSTLYAAVKTKKLPLAETDPIRRVRRSDLEAYLATRRD